MCIKEKFVCGKCVNFVQHYIKFNAGYQRVYYGHCIHPKLKQCRPDKKACIHFEMRDSLLESFLQRRGKNEF